MFRLIRWLDYDRTFPQRVYYITDTDTTSVAKARAFEDQLENTKRQAPPQTLPVSAYRIETVPRSRAVGQSWVTTPVTVLRTFRRCLPLVWRNPPDILLCNGPGTCVPFVMACILTKFFGCRAPRIIYVESFARVKSLSFTGRLLYPLADRFVVQWPDLIARYPHAEYRGILV
ncbi:UDP-N-acetylglucosamine transferase subunit [Tieghemiomyces parasiticus]|uniref:UDP-N-acetylglucosamine transferase subunit ALG14 n=1 Tax=Tieghemiomyces parasiticus TaxID=78921 RepID=A0A9W7ZPD4_9FUNG|nr:UDP-N-acetylglucosamine transferase subunit [Tieghemiomyces parasiticus]